MNLIQKRAFDNSRRQRNTEFRRNQTIFGHRRQSDTTGFQKIPSDLEQRIRTLKDSDRILSCRSKHFKSLNRDPKDLKPKWSEIFLHFSVRPWICAVLTNLVVCGILIGK